MSKAMSIAEARPPHRSTDGLGDEHGVEGRAAQQLVTADEEVHAVFTEDVILAHAANLEFSLRQNASTTRISSTITIPFERFFFL